MDLVTNKKRIKDLILEEGKIFRKVLGKELNIAPRNLNRNIDKLIAENIIEKDKDGKEIFYIPKIIQEPVIIQEITELEPEIPRPDTFKTTRHVRVTKAQKVYDYIKEKGGEISNRVLREKFNIPTRKFAQYLKPKTRTGELKWRKIGKESFYRLGDTPVTEVVRRTKSDATVKQLTELETFQNYLLNRRYSSRTITEYTRNIIKLYKWKNKFDETHSMIYPVTAWTLNDIEGFRTHLRKKKKYSDFALHGVMVALKAYFKYLKRFNLILENFLQYEPLPTIEDRPQPSISMDDFWDLVKSAKNSKYPLRNITLLLTMMETGARVSEIATICREHIEFQGKSLLILGEKKKYNDGKREPRRLPISDLTLTYLRKTIEAKEKVNEKVFYYIHNEKEFCGTAIWLTRHNIFLKSAQIRTIIQQLRQNLRSHKKVTVHSFRRFILIDLVNRGLREDYASARAGQRPRNMSLTTFDYIRWTPEWKEEYERQYQLFHPLNQPDIIRKFNAIVEAE